MVVKHGQTVKTPKFVLEVHLFCLVNDGCGWQSIAVAPMIGGEFLPCPLLGGTSDANHWSTRPRL